MKEDARTRTQALDVEEPLILSAPIAKAMAEHTCGSDPLTRGSCAWYHGFWQYIRLLGLGAAPSVHSAFLLPTLRRLATTGEFGRVLISGSADYSMLAHVVSAYRGEVASLQPMIVDVCDTPLNLNRWYAERFAIDIDTRRCDIRQFEHSRRFDLVCTHAFLGYFSTNERSQVVRKWWELLRPGGKVITIQRTRPAAGQRALRFTQAQRESFVNRIAQVAEEDQRLDEDTKKWVVTAAQEYAEKFWTHPINTEGELARLFEEASFHIETLDKAVSAPQAESGLSGPTMPMQAEYVFVVAVRQ
jgi:SAM-dependent methyltransferase